MTNWNDQLTQLNQLLAGLVPDKELSVTFVEMAGIPRSMIAFNNMPMVNWHNILSEANKREKIEDLVDVISASYPSNSELKEIYRNVTEQLPLQDAAGLYEQTLKQMIAVGKTGEALEELASFSGSLDRDGQNLLILKRSQFNRLKTENQQGILDRPTYSRELNRINLDLLHIIDDMQ